jgi:hypothetical protein
MIPGFSSMTDDRGPYMIWYYTCYGQPVFVTLFEVDAQDGPSGTDVVLKDWLDPRWNWPGAWTTGNRSSTARPCCGSATASL